MKYTARQARVESFRNETYDLTERSITCPDSHAIIKITHASVGATDIVARRGDYILHPLPGFTPGYDFVGIVEHPGSDAASFSIRRGDRVAGITPSMGSHSTHLNIHPSLLVKVPKSLPSDVAATIPLDAITAQRVMTLLPGKAKRLFIQGITGSVGFYLAQFATNNNIQLAGTTSGPSTVASRWLTKQAGAELFDYKKPSWIADAIKSQGQFDAVLDHTGSSDIRQLARRQGRIIRTAFGGPAGKQRSIALRRSTLTLLKSLHRPSERICSTPLYVLTSRSEYRAKLRKVLKDAASGKIITANPKTVPYLKYEKALSLASNPTPGQKVILEL